MRSRISPLAVAWVAGAAMIPGGCAARNEAPPPPRSRIPDRPVRVPVHEYDESKPLPDHARGSQVDAPPFDDVPLVNQSVPEQRAFVDAYNGVGRPRILVFVNRTLEGEIVPVNPQD